jgi:adenylyltransferase/sulfurtransferase
MTRRRTELVASVGAKPGGSLDELVRLALERSGRADAVELRLDTVARPDLERLRDVRDRLGKLGKPVILTCRSPREGGSFAGDEEERMALLERAIALGFDYVDVEIDARATPLSRSGPTKLILSHHDFDGFPGAPERLIERALALGADVVKIAARVASLADSLRLAELGEGARAAGKDYAPVPLGPAGASARILAPKLGARFAYAFVGGGAATGPGQVPLEELEDLYRFSAIDERTEIYGIVGSNATTSLSPAMHNRLFERLGRNAVYVPFQETELEPFVSAARKLRVSGLSVTIPFKEAMLSHLDGVDDVARAIGAVNTVVARDGRFTGFNTDRDGVLEPLARFGPLAGRRAVVLGAGGAARAAAHALATEGASVRVLARNESRARELAASLGCDSGPLASLASTEWDLLVNATPVGSAGRNDSFEALGKASEGAVVFDMVTSPERTDLLLRAREAGASTVTGLEMLAAQAAYQALLWTGEKPRASELLGYARAGSDLSRYSRQVRFSEIGGEGQGRIRSSAVVVVGAGALGSVASEMLVRAGVGRLRLVDRDYVEESNLQRQSLYDETDYREGLPKAIAAARKLRRINGDVDMEGVVEDVHAGNAVALVQGADLILDGTDNFETRYLLNDVSLRTGIPWIYAACVGSYGMSFVVLPKETPCLRCFLQEEPAPGTSPTCDTAGVIAPAVHAVSAFQISEALKILSGRRDALTGAVLSLDVWRGSVESFRPARRREDCPACGLGFLDYLSGTSESHAVTLCGRNAVQVRPARPAELSLEEIASRLRELGRVTTNAYLLRAELDGREIVLFRDGRAIVHGTEDPSEARSLYARYVGS